MNSNSSLRKTNTAGELSDRRNEGPEYAARRQEPEEYHQESPIVSEQASAQVLADLAKAGFPVGYIGELRHKKLNYRTAIPILVHWLPRVNDVRVKEDIVRTLTVKWAKPHAVKTLLDEYRKAAGPSSRSLKWAIGNALSVIGDDRVFDDIAELVQDRRHGTSRQMLAVALGNMRDSRAIKLAIDLLSDDEVAGHALIALGKLKEKKAAPQIEQFLNHPKAWVRQEAKRALAKIERVP